MEKLKSFFSGIRDWAGKKMFATAVGLALTALKAAHPDWPLPSEELTLSLIGAYLACHTLTDVAHITLTAIKEYFAEGTK